MSKANITGIDIGSTRTRIAMYVEEDNQYYYGYSETRGIRDGSIVSYTETNQSIKEAIKMVEDQSNNEEVENIFVGVGGIYTEGKTIEVSINTDIIQGISEAEIEELHEELNRKIENDFPNYALIYHKIIRYRIDDQDNLVTTPIGLKSSKLIGEFFVVICFRQYLDSLEAALGDLDVIRYFPSPIAASTSISEMQLEAGCVLVDIGSKTLSITVFENKIPVHMKILPIGSSNITNDIAMEFKLPLDEAERCLEDTSTIEGKRARVEKVIEKRLKSIFALINEELKNIDKDCLLPGGVILSGGGASITPIKKIAKACLNLPVEIINKTNKSINRDYIDFKNSAWFVATGLTILGRKEKNKKRGGIKRMWKWFKNGFPTP